MIGEAGHALGPAGGPRDHRVDQRARGLGRFADEAAHLRDAVVHQEVGPAADAAAVVDGEQPGQAPGRARALHFRPRVGRVPSEVAQPAAALGLVERLHRRRLRELPVANPHGCLKRSASADRSPCGATAARLAGADLFVDFFAVDRNVGRRGDADADAVASDAQDADFDPVTDPDGFLPPAREDQHGSRPGRQHVSDRVQPVVGQYLPADHALGVDDDGRAEVGGRACRRPPRR